MTHHESYWDQHEVWYNCRDNDKLQNRYHQHAEIRARMWLYNAASLKLYFKITSLLLRNRYYVITYRFCFCSNFLYKQYFFHFVSKLDFLASGIHAPGPVGPRSRAAPGKFWNLRTGGWIPALNCLFHWIHNWLHPFSKLRIFLFIVHYIESRNIINYFLETQQLQQKMTLRQKGAQKPRNR